MRAWGTAWFVVAVVLASCNATPTAQPSIPAPQLISGKINTGSRCGGTQASQRPGEPSLAADPTNRSRLIAVWVDTPGLVVAVTSDGGKTWVRMTLPSVLPCDGGKYSAVADPWVSIGPDGWIYVSYLAEQAVPGSGAPNVVAVSVGKDHGFTWYPPVMVASGTSSSKLDKPSILADQRVAGRAYVVWADYAVTSAAEPSLDTVRFAGTSDSGRTWSAPMTLYAGNDEAQENQLLMTAGGALLDVFVEGSSLPAGATPPPLPVKVRVMRSTDHGATWSEPIDASSFTYTAAVDPGTGAELRAGGQNIVAAASGNAIYVAWFEDHRDFSSILVARSDDAGKTWRSPVVVVREKPEAFLPTIAVSGNGTVGMLWFDLRHYVSGSRALNVDAWFSASRDRGAHWTARHAAGPFDLRSAPPSRYGPFIGDYMGLVGVPSGFIAVYVMSKPPSRDDPTAVFMSRIAA